jgi:hypothetical protein
MSERGAGRVMDRGELGFVAVAQAAFNFLVEEFGFRLVKSEPPTFVRYESDVMFLNVYHGRRSYELGVEVGPLADPVGLRYGLPDVLGAILGWDDKSRTYFQASNAQAVRRCVGAIADLVASHYGAVLMGDRTVLERVAAYRSEKNQAYEKQALQRPVREAADKAWRAKDYENVQRLYSSIRNDLSLVERKRLDYAERHREG